MDTAWLLCVAAGYLSGSIPFGLLIGKARGVDVRKAGSGNIGATNVGRVLGRKWGGFCFALDVLKGLLPVLIAGLVLGYAGRRDLDPADAWRWLAVAIAAVLGHVFPVWLGFKGGKGVATALGVLLGFWPVLTLPGLAALVTWVAVVAVTRYVSLGSVLAAIALPAYVAVGAWLAQTPVARVVPFLVVTGLMAALVIARHRANIARLLAGTENKLGSRPAGHA
ncbi:MAG: glycerol-3-phosphate 1-O-acyltransferase PlsY [Planctomycetota bacterium]|nr:glycerol-3-phosphate 1-O-acyltransferase PlsY [Planctomycetota bacterium]